MKITHTTTDCSTSVPNTFKNLAPHIQSVSPAFTLIDKPDIDVVSIHIDGSYSKYIAIDYSGIETITIGKGWTRIVMESGSTVTFYETGFFNTMLF